MYSKPLGLNLVQIIRWVLMVLVNNIWLTLVHIWKVEIIILLNLCICQRLLIISSSIINSILSSNILIS
jgi:hypothetical protein